MSDWPPSFQAYGVTLKPLAADDLERVRQWRNDPQIARLMRNQTEISAQQQQRWFAGLTGDPQRAYWVTYFKNEPIGVASLVNIDKAAGTAESGMYIYPQQYRGNIVPFCVAFALNDFAFEHLQLNALQAVVKPDNMPAIRFNEKMGYRATGEDQDGLLSFVLEPEPYRHARAPIARFIRY